MAAHGKGPKEWRRTDASREHRKPEYTSYKWGQQHPVDRAPDGEVMIDPVAAAGEDSSSESHQKRQRRGDRSSTVGPPARTREMIEESQQAASGSSGSRDTMVSPAAVLVPNRRADSRGPSAARHDDDRPRPRDGDGTQRIPTRECAYRDVRLTQSGDHGVSYGRASSSSGYPSSSGYQSNRNLGSYDRRQSNRRHR